MPSVRYWTSESPMKSLPEGEQCRLSMIVECRGVKGVGVSSRMSEDPAYYERAWWAVLDQQMTPRKKGRVRLFLCCVNIIECP